MKTTKLFILAAFALCLGTAAQAQSGRLSIGLELAQPVGDLGDYASTGFGGSLRYEHPMGDKLGLGLTAGYITFGEETDGIKFNMIPVQAFLKFYLGEQQAGLYFQGDIGIHSTSVDIEGFDSESSSDMSYAFGGGFHMAHIDLGLRYQMISAEDATNSYIGLRVAYAFGGD